MSKYFFLSLFSFLLVAQAYTQSSRIGVIKVRKQDYRQEGKHITVFKDVECSTTMKFSIEQIRVYANGEVKGSIVLYEFKGSTCDYISINNWLQENWKQFKEVKHYTSTPTQSKKEYFSRFPDLHYTIVFVKS